jgi:uncharacterized protein (DUF362 family)
LGGRTTGEADVLIASCHTYGDAQRGDTHALTEALRGPLEHMGLDPDNPLDRYVSPGECVVIKPNWVMHANQSPAGLECLVTHPQLVSAVIQWCFRAMRGRGRIIVGDAPLQGCDLSSLMRLGGYEAVKARCAQTGIPVEWHDFRRSVLVNAVGGPRRLETGRGMEDYLLSDLAAQSLLEPLSQDSRRFRVTMYDPDVMREAHRPGLHRYLVAREVMDANLVINLPKLKTHKKACVTGALKNVVGINGSKDYLPHHRLGGSKNGGDCYAGGNPFKLIAEYLLDAANREEGTRARLLGKAALGSYGLARVSGADANLDGSWYGNDTVWRMVLDLNRVLLYGRRDGTMADTPQRRVLSVTDAIVSGQGEGPLAPDPHQLGVVTWAENAAAADLVHARLMGFDWRKIPVIREAFSPSRYPLCPFAPEDVVVWREGERHRQPWPEWNDLPFRAPDGWRGHCEREPRGWEA